MSKIQVICISCATANGGVIYSNRFVHVPSGQRVSAAGLIVFANHGL